MLQHRPLLVFILGIRFSILLSRFLLDDDDDDDDDDGGDALLVYSSLGPRALSLEPSSGEDKGGSWGGIEKCEWACVDMRTWPALLLPYGRRI